MSKISVSVIHLIFCYAFFCDRCSGILVAEKQPSKPSYTPGIKTANWKNSILTHQNYSRVNVHNNPDAQAQYIVTQTQETQKIYPVYNAHSYGPRTHQGILETKSHTDIDTSEFPRPNRTIIKRKIEYKSMEIYEKCPSGVTGQFVYISSCNQYLNCWKGRGVVQNCSPGTLFNPKSLECDFPDKVECITGPTQATYANIRVAKSLRQANCPEGFSGLIPNYTDCSKFISCSNGQPFPMDCPPGTLFDINQNICDHPKKCTCFNGQSGADFTIQVGHLGSLSGRQNQGQYHQTIYGQTRDCQNLGSNCGQNSQAQSQFESSSGNIQYTNQHQGSHQNSPGIQQSSTRLYPIQIPTKTTFTLTHGQSNCNPQYQNCGQQIGQTQGSFHGQGVYGQSNSNTGYSQTTTRANANNYHISQGQGILYGQSDRRDNIGNVDTTKCKLQGQSCLQSIDHNTVTEPNCNPSIQNCVQTMSQSQNPDMGENKQTHIQTHSSGRTCNPFLQNCRQIDGQGQGSTSDQTVRYIYGTAQKCNPATENCGQGQESSNSQTQIYSSGQNCNPSIQNCGQGQQSFNSQTQIYSSGRNCNPSIQNCGQFQGSSTWQGHGSSGGQTIIQTSGHKCDPSVQNCGQHQSSSSGQGYGSPSGQTIIHTSGQNCNPSLGNCGQTGRYPTDSQTLIHTSSSGQNCNPFLQNCNQNNGQGSSQIDYGDIRTTERSTTPSITHGQNCNPSSHNCSPKIPLNQDTSSGHTLRQFFCDPRTGLCRQNAEQSRTTIQSFSQTSQIHGQTGAVQVNCDLSAPNCGQNSRYEQTRLNGHISSQNPPNTNSDTRNYNTICNINDNNCRKGHTIVTRRITPVCPDNFQGLTKHPHDCKKFLSCANGQTFIQDCAPGTLFNPSLGNCDFPYNVDCKTSEGVSIDSGTTYGEDWNREYEGNVQEIGPNENIRSTSEKPDDSIQGVTGSFSKWSNVNIHNTITETNNGEIGLVSRPTYQTTTQTTKQIEKDISQTPGKFPDYVDVFDPKEQSNKGYYSTTPRSAWPPPFPKSVTEADYVFDYEDGESVTLDPDDIFYAREKKSSDCDDNDFHCSADFCISQTMVCDGHRDCGNGKDELLCEEYIARFSVTKNSQLVVLEKQRWINASFATCAVLCIQNTKFICRSFNYRKIDRTCFLSDQNIGLTGALRKYFPTDYYELKTGSVDCSDRSKYFECSNKKCLMKEQVCDGADDCGDRQDEKNCKSEDFGYSIKLSGSKEKNEGRVEVTAFGKTGYICDDQFGIQDANVICKELGFQLGAAEVKGQSYFAKDLKENNTLYMMDEVECIGNESTLLNCGFAGWGVHDCRDQEIAGVVCKTPQEKCGAGFWRCDTGNECVPYAFVCDGVNDCTDDSDERNEYCEAPTEIRLVNGSRSSEGRLEIKHHGIWGTVCDDDFNEDAAKVVCKYFGYRGKSTVKKDAYFGKGDGPIWLDQVSCFGNETELETCTHWNWGEHNCEHDEDVSVICSDEMIEVEVQRSAKLPIRFETGLPKKCGFRKDNQFLENDLIHARVVSGSVARKGEYPWQAALKVKVKETTAHWCGAVIISSKWVLTAAHCLQGYTKGAYVIVAGEYNTDEVEGTEQQKYIEEFFIHERFRKGHKMNNDIALIKVKGGGFELNDDVQPICLPDTDVPYDQDLNCTISGFGSVKSGISVSSHDMMAAWIPIHSNEICKMPHIYGSALAEGMFCAGFLDGGVDACDGDSGGPLACLDQGYFTLYGLTSWGQHCGYANKPGVYVKVAYYRPWIEDIIQRHS